MGPGGGASIGGGPGGGGVFTFSRKPEGGRVGFSPREPGEAADGEAFVGAAAEADQWHAAFAVGLRQRLAAEAPGAVLELLGLLEQPAVGLEEAEPAAPLAVHQRVADEELRQRRDIGAQRRFPGCDRQLHDHVAAIHLEQRMRPESHFEVQVA